MRKRYTVKEWGTAFEAFILLGFARAIVLTLPFSFVSKSLGQTTPVERKTQDCSSAPLRLAIQRASRYTPWTSNCLAQSLTASWMMRMRGMSSVTYLGVRRDQTGSLIAHSWTQSNEDFVTGAKGHELFHVTQTFYR